MSLPDNPIFNKMADAERKKAEALRDEAQTQALLPAFRVIMAELITSKIPEPSVKPDEPMNGRSGDVWELGSAYRTTLTVSIPMPEGESVIKVSASDYPDIRSSDSVQKTNYIIDPTSLSEIVRIVGDRATLESKERKIDPKSVHGIFNGQPRLMPAESGVIPPDYLRAYGELMGSLGSIGARFEGSTPPKRVRSAF